MFIPIQALHLQDHTHYLLISTLANQDLPQLKKVDNIALVLVVNISREYIYHIKRHALITQCQDQVLMKAHIKVLVLIVKSITSRGKLLIHQVSRNILF